MCASKKRLFMRRSKLEINLDILKILAQNGSLKMTHIMYKANVNCESLKNTLGYLIKQGLIEKRLVDGKRIVYSITHQGLTLSKGWKEIKQSLAAEENETVGQSLFRNFVSIRA
jgi:predicted transcriptional regulator